MVKLTETVKKKIAFAIFSTNKTHAQIASEFGISRSKVSQIAGEYKLQRKATGGHGGGNYTGTKHKKNDIETVNWTFDDALILKRIQRRHDNIQHEINKLVNAATKL